MGDKADLIDLQSFFDKITRCRWQNSIGMYSVHLHMPDFFVIMSF